MYLIKKNIFILLSLFILMIYIFACGKKEIKKDILIRDYLTSDYKDLTISELINNAKNKKKSSNYTYYDVLDCEPFEIIVPKNQSNAQSLSIVINDNCGHLIVFDGGRVEDADYLCDIIKDNGGIVTSWFITHIHDDHIGALYEILNKKRTDIEIKEIIYIFENVIKNYNEYLKLNNLDEVNIINQNNIKSNSGLYLFDYNVNVKDTSPLFICGNSSKETIEELNELNKKERYSKHCIMRVSILNDLYLLDQDPINNTSIVYYINFFEPKKFGMLIFGDLGYEGGNLLFSNFNYDDKTKFKNKIFFDDTKIIVLSHHGQNGIDPELYKKFNPKVVIWSTSKDIYENVHGKYYTNDTKKVLSEINSIECQIKSYEETAVIR